MTKGKKPTASTDEEVLEALKESHPIPAKLLEYRKLFKLLNTYVLGIKDCMDDEDRIHATFLIHGTATGRLSCQEPNLQNIPRDDKRIKKLFIARPGWRFIEADYGQAEFRHWANYSQDDRMLADLRAGKDIHKYTASEVFGIPVEQVTKAQRQQAKATVFGLMYGRGAKSLAEEFGMTEMQANRIIHIFFSKYPMAKAWLEAAVNTVKQHKRIRNIFGRLRRLESITSPDFFTRMEAERQSQNSPIQSAASDMNCNAANKIKLRFADKGLQGNLCLLVHDSLLYEVPENEFEESLNIIKNTMEENIQGVNVPMVAEFKVGNRWGELEIVEREKDGLWYQEINKQKVIYDFKAKEKVEC